MDSLLTFAYIFPIMCANMVNGSDQQEQWLSIGEAAEFLGISRDTLRRWEKKGKVKVYRSPTNRRIYKQADLDLLYKDKSSNHQTTGSPHRVARLLEQETANLEKKENEETKYATFPESKEVKGADLQTEYGEDHEEMKNIKETVEIGKPVALAENTQESEKIEEKVEENSVLKREMPETPQTTYEPPITPPMTNISLARPTLTSMPMTPPQMSSFSQAPTVVSEENVVANPTNALKIVAIVLALILVGLGVTITALVFV